MCRSRHGAVFVDLSNVAKDPAIAFSNEHADLARWDRLKALWVRDHGVPESWLLVADDSLVRALGRSGRMRLESLRGRGEAILVPDADSVLLRRAVDVSGSVLSNDRFVDHLRMPGLDRVALTGWAVRDGVLRLVPRSLDRLQSVLISQRAEKQLRKELGLSDEASELAFKWYCRHAPCPRDLVALPRRERGRAVCPQCGSYLEQGQSWNRPIWLKVMHASDEVMRFVLEDGDRTVIGRASDDATVSLAGEIDLAPDVLVLDLHHAELVNDKGTLWVTDLDTRNGTTIRYPAAGRRKVLMPPVPLWAGREISVPPGAKVVLGSTPFTVQVAGKAAE